MVKHIITLALTVALVLGTGGIVVQASQTGETAQTVQTAKSKSCSVTYKGHNIVENTNAYRDNGNHYYWLILNGYTEKGVNLSDFQTIDKKPLTENNSGLYSVGINEVPQLVQQADGTYSKSDVKPSLIRITTGNGKSDLIYIVRLPLGVPPDKLGTDIKYVVDTSDNIKYNEFKSNEAGKWYEMYDGTYPKDVWQNINGSWYKFNSGGYVITGWISEDKPEGITWYYCNSDGIMQTGWVQLNDNWYYLKPEDGSLMVNTTTPDGYYVDGNGAMVGKN